MNTASVLVLVVFGVLFVFAVRWLRKRGGCGCGCDRCTGGCPKCGCETCKKGFRNK